MALAIRRNNQHDFAAVEWVEIAVIVCGAVRLHS